MSAVARRAKEEAVVNGLQESQDFFAIFAAWRENRIRTPAGKNASRPDTGESGNAVDFFVKIRGMSFLETMRLLLA